MQDPLYLLRGLLPTVVDRILKGVDGTTSGNVKFQTIGIYYVIFALFDSDREATVSRLAKMGNVTKTHAAKLANSLVKLGLIERSPIHSSHGKGRQYLYRPVHDADKLLKLFGTLSTTTVPFSQDKDAHN